MKTITLELSKSSCRICLQEGATYPIFDDSSGHNIHSQLNKCFVEKMEDLEGYPRNICSSCKIVLDMLCEFIDRYKESCKILKEAMVKVKSEIETEYDDNFVWEEEEEDEEKCIEIKIENSVQNKSNASLVIDNLKPVLGLQINKVESQKCTKDKDSKRSNRKKRNKEIAFSILESPLEWNGEKWSLKKETTKVKDKKTFKQKGKTKVQKMNKEKDQKKNKVKDKQKHTVLCDYCGAVFKIKYKLREHIQAHHIKVPITCNICSKIYSSETRLKEHTRRYHGEMILKCEHCPSKFALQSVLNSHIKSVHKKHLKPKKTYSCKFCDKKYKCPASIVVHERTVHTGLLPCVCNVCDKAFSHDMYLRQHMRLHTGELPFLCPICQRGYTQLSNMKSHLRVHKVSELNDEIMKKFNTNYLKLLKNA